MKRVEIAGAGLHPFGRFTETPAGDIVATAVHRALDMAEMTVSDIDIAVCGHSLPDSGGGSRAMLEAGVTSAPVINVDAACASSAVATVVAAEAIATERVRTALVVGYEKMPRGMLRSARPQDPFGDLLGLEAQPVRYALKARDYMLRYGVSDRAIASVAVKSRRQASMNPNAHLRQPVSLEAVMESPLISDPLTRYQCCPSSDGAAALVLTSDRSTGVTLRAWAIGNQLGSEEDDGSLSEETTAALAEKVYNEAGIGPSEVEVAQVHDAFTIGEVVRVEALGLIPQGEAAIWTSQGRTTSEGDMPVNTDGGLLSRGHPLGATGVAQLIELFLQIGGMAGARQVPSIPRVGLAQNTGGGENGATVVTLVAS